MGTKTSTTYTMTAQPSWYTNSAKDLLAKQATLAAQPYTPYGGERVAGFTPGQTEGFGTTRAAANAYQPSLNAATAATTGAMGRSGFTAAQPFLERAGQSSADMIGTFMNPYLENVVNRYGEIGARTLREQLIPGVTNKYIQAGQLGGPTRGGTGATGAPSGMMTDSLRALRDVQEGVAQQQAQALSQGYSEALNAAQQEQARMGALASTYGGLYNADTSNQLTGAGQMAQLAQQEQQQGLAAGKALTDVGAQEQALIQRGNDVAYENYLRENGYNQAQIDAMTRTMGAVAPAIPTGSTSVQTNRGPSSSMLGTLAGGALTYAGASNAYNRGNVPTTTNP